MPETVVLRDKDRAGKAKPACLGIEKERKLVRLGELAIRIIIVIDTGFQEAMIVLVDGS